MRKLPAALALLLVSTGCATMADHWNRIDIGQSKSDVVGLMGPPQQAGPAENGQEFYSWGIKDTCDACAVRFSSDGTVNAKKCKTDSACEERYESARSAFIQGYFGARGAQISAPQPAYVPVQSYQVPVRPQTNCTTNMIGDTADTRCR